MAEELITVDAFGTKKVQFALHPNWRDDFNEYQAGYDSAPDKLEYNRQAIRKIHERNFKCGNG